MTLRASLVLAAILSATLAAAPESAPPATAPTSQPTTQEANPISTYVEYSELARQGKGQAMLDLFLLRTNDEGKAAISVVRADLAMAQLAATTEEKFGRSAMIAQQRAIGDVRAEWLVAKVQTVNEVRLAVLQDDGGTPVTTMQFHQGHWRFTITPFIDKLGGTDKFITAANQQRQRAEKLRADLQAGRFKTSDQLITAITSGT